jgi:hypothetical protein
MSHLSDSLQQPSSVPQPIAKNFPSGTQYPPGSMPQQQPLRSLSVTPGAGLMLANSRGFQNSPTTMEAPTAANPRRGATPTNQIVRGKPPTPPPTTRQEHLRERSKSPYSLKLQRGSSNSAPPLIANRQATETDGQAAAGGNGAQSAVNPNLLALRQSLYAKERHRMGLPREAGQNGNQPDWIDEDNGWDEPTLVEEAPPKQRWTNSPIVGTQNRQQTLQQQVEKTIFMDLWHQKMFFFNLHFKAIPAQWHPATSQPAAATTTTICDLQQSGKCQLLDVLLWGPGPIDAGQTHPETAKRRRQRH